MVEVAEDNWITLAISNVDKYLHRGGEGQGDIPQKLNRLNLRNTIGTVLGLRPTDPTCWSEKQWELAVAGELCCFEGAELEQIDMLVDKIESNCGGDTTNFVTVLPIELYSDGKLYEVPLFRFHRYVDSAVKFIDHTGRVYTDGTLDKLARDDWYHNNRYPPCQMAFPCALQLQYRPGYNYSHILYCTTPLGRSGSKVARGIDITAGIVGIGSTITACFLSGGLAIPFVAAGAISAAWGTGKAAYSLNDRALHDQSLNPFTDAEARLMWFNIAASCLCFGAMGFSAKLGTMATNGKEISNGFKIFVNTINGTNLAVSTLALGNSVWYMVDHWEQMTPVDVLLQCLAIAFWAKTTFQYRTAGQLIQQARTSAIQQMTKGMSAGQLEQFASLRDQIANDQQLLNCLHKMTQTGINPHTFPWETLKYVWEADKAVGLDKVSYNSDGSIQVVGIHFSEPLLNSMSPNGRQELFSIVGHLSDAELRSFAEMRAHLNNDVNLLTQVGYISNEHQITPLEATRGVLRLWDQVRQTQGAPKMLLQRDQIVIGNGHTFSIPQIESFGLPALRFVAQMTNILSVADSQQLTIIRQKFGNDNTLFDWLAQSSTDTPHSALRELINLQNSHLFNCHIELINDCGKGVMVIAKELKISIFKLANITDVPTIHKLISLLQDADANAVAIGQAAKKLRLKLESDRKSAAAYFTQHSAITLDLVDLKPHEYDRMIEIKTRLAETVVIRSNCESILLFAANMNPKSVSEMAAYCEFAMISVTKELASLSTKRPHLGTKIVKRLRGKEYKSKLEQLKVTEASKRAFGILGNISPKKLEWLSKRFGVYLTWAIEKDMVGVAQLPQWSTDAELIAAIRTVDVKFGAATSAAYHLFKHQLDTTHEYVDRANTTIRTTPMEQISIEINQEGDSRIVAFTPVGKRVIVLVTSDNKCLLCTFISNRS